MRTRPNLAAASSASSGAILETGTDIALDRSDERIPPAPASGWFGGGVSAPGREGTVAIGEYPPVPGPAPPPGLRTAVDDVFDRRPAGAGLRILPPDDAAPTGFRNDDFLPPAALPPPAFPPLEASAAAAAAGFEVVAKPAVLLVALTGVNLTEVCTEDDGVPVAALPELAEAGDGSLALPPPRLLPPPTTLTYRLPPPASASDPAVSSGTLITVPIALSFSSLGCRCRSPSKSFLRRDAKKPSSSSSSASPSLLGAPTTPPPPAALLSVELTPRVVAVALQIDMDDS